MTDNDSWERIPCGCQFGTVGDVFVFEPHALDCEAFLYALSEAERQGKPIQTMDAR